MSVELKINRNICLRKLLRKIILYFMVALEIMKYLNFFFGVAYSNVVSFFLIKITKRANVITSSVIFKKVL